MSLRRPSPAKIQAFLEAQAKLKLTYEAIGATSSVPPHGYVVDHTRIRLGEGEDFFLRAKSALGRWAQFQLGWVEAWSTSTPIRTGEVVAVLARRLGLWWLNACRIVYVIDERTPLPRFGFAYGTLPAHAGAGEERFLVEWDPESGEVWYDILAFSRPQNRLTQFGRPYMRRVQKRFGRESAAAMRRAVQEDRTT